MYWDEGYVFTLAFEILEDCPVTDRDFADFCFLPCYVAPCVKHILFHDPHSKIQHIIDRFSYAECFSRAFGLY